MLEEDKAGKKPLYRDRNWNAEERIQEYKQRKTKNQTSIKREKHPKSNTKT